MRQKIITAAVAVILLLSCAVTAAAVDYDLERRGSITVTLREQEQKDPIAGAELSFYHVATVSADSDGEAVYTYTSYFEDFTESLEDPDLLTKLDAFVKTHTVTAIRVKTNERGTAVCSDLPMGIYFIEQTGGAPAYAPCTSFLVTLPGSDENGHVYDVIATPKTEIAKLTTITVKKVWNTDSFSKVPEDIMIQLLQHEQVLDTTTLNEENDWFVQYKDMPESDAYRIQELNVPKGFTATYGQNGYEFIITNTASLAQTGQLQWPVPVLAIAGLFFLGLGAVILKKPRGSDA